MTLTPPTLRRCGLSAAVLFTAAAGLAAPPAADDLLARALTAAGGAKALADAGVVELQLNEEETKASGAVASAPSHVYISGSRLEHLRTESRGWTLVRSGGAGWASVNGQPDQRPQTPKMASGSVTASLFPLLLPFSLSMEGIRLGEVSETSFEGTPAYKLVASFPEGFFFSPVMSTRWSFYLAKSDATPLAAEFLPPATYGDAGAIGMRYRYLTWQKIGGCRLPAKVMVDGVDASGTPTGHTRVTTITGAVRGPWDPSLFLSPTALQAIEGED